MDIRELGLEAPENVAGAAYLAIYGAMEQVAATGGSLQDLTDLLEGFEETAQWSMDAGGLVPEPPANVAGVAYRAVCVAMKQAVDTRDSLQDATALLKEFRETALEMWARVALIAETSENVAAETSENVAAETSL